MDLMSPMQVESIAGKMYIFVFVDDSPDLLGCILLGRNQTLLIPLETCA